MVGGEPPAETTAGAGVGEGSDRGRPGALRLGGNIRLWGPGLGASVDEYGRRLHPVLTADGCRGQAADRGGVTTTRVRAVQCRDHLGRR